MADEHNEFGYGFSDGQAVATLVICVVVIAICVWAVLTL
jgi:hypothetical protein